MARIDQPIPIISTCNQYLFIQILWKEVLLHIAIIIFLTSNLGVKFCILMTAVDVPKACNVAFVGVETGV